MYVMVGNRVTEAIKKEGRKLTLKDGSKCDITQVKYFWKKRIPYENKRFLNPELLREMFRLAQYKNTHVIVEMERK